jgi:tetratricopeptide (TPR) repeat protein
VLILTHTMGITGTALGMALGGAAQVVCQLVFVQREVLRLFPIWWPPRQMLGQVAAYAAGFAVPRLLLSVIPGYAGVAVALVAGTLVYGLVLAAVGLLPRDRARARMVVDRARGALPARWRPATPQRAHIGIQGEANGAGPSELDAAFRRGEELERAGDNAGAEAAYRSADRGGHAAAACNLGVLLEGRGAIAAAQAAYARADRRGDPNGAFNLGLLLQEEGDLADATAAFQRADQRGHAAAACNLGAVLELQGNVAGAAAAYRRAEARGHFGGAFNLGLLLGRQGEPAAARAAFERAEQDGGEIAELARAALADLEVPDGRQGSRSRRRFRMRVGERV